MSIDERVWKSDDMDLEEDEVDDTDYSIKPSLDINDREAVNGRLRAPEHKTRSHIPPKIPSVVNTNIKYGEHITEIDSNRAKEYNIPKSQERALEKLLRVLRTPTVSPRRQASLMELYEDLKQYPKSVLPQRSSHDGLMATLSEAVTGNLQIDLKIIQPYSVNGKIASGYSVGPVI